MIPPPGSLTLAGTRATKRNKKNQPVVIGIFHSSTAGARQDQGDAASKIWIIADDCSDGSDGSDGVTNSSKLSQSEKLLSGNNYM